MGFKEDLEFGDKWAEAALERLGITKYRKIEGKFLYFDYVAVEEEGIVLYEMKADTRGHKTGNVCIEFKSSGNSSGITTSIADYWCYWMTETKVLYKIPTSYLKECVEKKWYWRTVECCERGKNECYLMPSHLFEEYEVCKKDDTDKC